MKRAGNFEKYIIFVFLKESIHLTVDRFRIQAGVAQW